MWDSLSGGVYAAASGILLFCFLGQAGVVCGGGDFRHRLRLVDDHQNMRIAWGQDHSPGPIRTTSHFDEGHPTVQGQHPDVLKMNEGTRVTQAGSGRRGAEIQEIRAGDLRSDS